MWATYNVGANSATECGKYFAWCDTTGYYANEAHNFSWVTYKWCNGTNTTLTKYNNASSYGVVDNKLTLDSEDDAVHVHMGGDWHIPTQAQIKELNSFTTNQWVKNYQGTGVNGRLYTSWKDASKSIFIPASGYRQGSSIDRQESICFLWSSNIYADGPHLATTLAFDINGYNIISQDRNCGLCVRGVI